MNRADVLIQATLVLVVVIVCPALGAGDPADGRIRPYAKNPYYWQYKGAPVLLLGGTVEDNLFQIRDMIAHLDLLASVGGNYVRNTMSARDPGNVQAFSKAEDGQKYNLDRFNDEYWRRFERLLVETAKRDIVVQIEIWATFDYYRDLWSRCPFHPKNNVNYTAEESGVPLVVNSHPVRAQNDFFRSAPSAKNLVVVRRYQERFVAKLLEHSLKYDHVLYCMDNETAVTPTWGAYWANLIRQAAARRGKQVEVTEMWDNWNINHAHHNATVDHPETYTFIDVSQNNHQKGQRHYDNPQILRRRIQDRPRPINNVKIYGADGGRFGTTRDAIERFWRNIFSGLASARFHRPDSGIGLSETAQRMIRSAREAVGAFDIFACQPRNDLISDRKANEAYCLANPPHEYAVYFPAAGHVTLDVGSNTYTRHLRWLNVDGGEWRPTQRISTPKVSLRTPARGQWVAVITTHE
jgi:hypothetical protein